MAFAFGNVTAPDEKTLTTGSLALILTKSCSDGADISFIPPGAAKISGAIEATTGNGYVAVLLNYASTNFDIVISRDHDPSNTTTVHALFGHQR